MLQESTKIWLLKRAPITIIGVILIGLFVSALYDLLVKPGLSTVGRKLLYIVTLGSETALDTAYYSAALDPRPISSLMLLIIIVSIMLSIIFILVITPTAKSFKNKIKKDSEKKNTNFVLILYFFIILYAGGITITLGIHNESVLIWRVFHANLAIVTPHIDDTQKKELLAKFASMKGKSDYEEINKTVITLAENNDLKLKDINLW